MQRLLGIDYGTHRIGVALSDPLGITAQPLAVCSSHEFFNYLRTAISEYNIQSVVVGMPFSMDGSENKKSGEVRQFAEKIRSTFNIEVIFYDERFSTAGVERLLTDEADISRAKRKKVKDKLSACIILQGYLDSVKGS